MTVEKVYSSDYEDYEFSVDQKVGSFTRQIDVTAEDVDTIITNAFEGGSNYWLSLDGEHEQSVWKDKPKGLPWSTWATQMLLEGKTLHFYDDEDEDEKFTLNLEGLINGIRLNAEQRPWDSNLESGDACTADCIIQYGIFGKLVYG